MHDLPQTRMKYETETSIPEERLLLRHQNNKNLAIVIEVLFLSNKRTSLIGNPEYHQRHAFTTVQPTKKSLLLRLAQTLIANGNSE